MGAGSKSARCDRQEHLVYTARYERQVIDRIAQLIRGPRTFGGDVTLLRGVEQTSAARAKIPAQVCAASSTRHSHNHSSSPLRGCE